MAGVANDYVVEDFDFQKLASADEVAGNLDVGFTGGGSPLGWLWVRMRAAADVMTARRKTWQRVNKDRVMGAEADNVVGLHAAAGVEEQHGEALAFGVEGAVARHVQAPVGGGASGVSQRFMVRGAGLARGQL